MRSRASRNSRRMGSMTGTLPTVTIHPISFYSILHCWRTWQRMPVIFLSPSSMQDGLPILRCSPAIAAGKMTLPGRMISSKTCRSWQMTSRSSECVRVCGQGLCVRRMMPSNSCCCRQFPAEIIPRTRYSIRRLRRT